MFKSTLSSCIERTSITTPYTAKSTVTITAMLMFFTCSSLIVFTLDSIFLLLSIFTRLTSLHIGSIILTFGSRTTGVLIFSFTSNITVQLFLTSGHLAYIITACLVFSHLLQLYL